MSELRSASYWVGHGVMILATVIGVFLAATVGFKQALKLDLLQADRGTYYVSESLFQELQFNDQNMQKYIKGLEGKSLVFNEHIEGIKLNSFMFSAAEESESVFEIVPDLLSEVSQYYFNVGNALDLYYKSNMESPANLMNVIKAETRKLAEQETLNRLEDYNNRLAVNLKERGIPVER